MARRFGIALLFAGVILPGFLYARQVDTVQVQVQEQLEQAFEELDDEDGVAGEELVQFLEDLAENPVNLNSAGIDQLLQIPGLNLKIASAIIAYRKTKPFENKEELLKVSGIGKVAFARISPYVAVGGAASRFTEVYRRPEYWLSGRKLEFISRYQQELQEQAGYLRPADEGGYLGSPAKYYQRLKMTGHHFSVNLTQEKDAGEALKGPADFDFNSGHVALLQNGKLKSFVVGDYSLGFGQGLTLWNGASFGKGREVIRTAGKNERGLKPYSSAQETDFFRGVAATYGETVELTGFYSNRFQTASVISADTTRFPSATGFHRTQNELARKNNLGQLTYGGRVRVNSEYGFLGVTAYRNEFDKYIAKAAGLSNLYDFEGRTNSVLGLDYRGLIGSTLVFGEWARSQNGGMGAVLGTETSVGSNTNLTLHYRNYARDFQSFMGVGFGESSGSPGNEEGFYVGIQHLLSSVFTLSGYVDQFRFPAPRRGLTQASGGMDILGLVEADINRNLNIYLLARNKITDAEYSVINSRGLEELILGKSKRSSLRVQADYQVSREARLRSRVELIYSKKAGGGLENGFLIYQDIRFYPVKKIQIDARYTIFDTDSFDTRVYQFENDLLYVMSNTMLSGQGQRGYVVVKYEALKMLDVWIKYGVSIFENVQTISSGLNEIKGRIKNNIGIQMRLKL